jgi:hypothetical protein
VKAVNIWTGEQGEEKQGGKGGKEGEWRFFIYLLLSATFLIKNNCVINYTN